MSNKFKLKQTNTQAYEVGAYRFVFNINEKNIRKGKVDGTFLKISERNGQWSLTIDGNSHVFGYLLEAAHQGKLEQLEGYARLVWSVSMLLTQDQTLTDDVATALNGWHERMMQKGAEAAEKVTKAEELASRSLMEDIVSEQGLSKKELKAKREADKALMREILNDKEGEV